MIKRTVLITAATIVLGYAENALAYDEKALTPDESSIRIEEIAVKGGTIKPGETPGPITPPQVNPLPGPTTGPVINPPIDQNNAPNNPNNPSNGGADWTDVNNTIDALDKIVNLMEKIFAIIEKNQPVVNVAVDYANAVPSGTSHWTQLQGWSKPMTKRYAFSMKNLYGSEVVKVIYQVHYTYQGNYQGKGKFLTGVTVEPINIETAWGYKVSVTAEVPDSTIANVGTHEDPIASMQVQLKWTVHTMFKDITSKAIYYVQGDGFLKEIGTPFKAAAEEKNQKQIEKITEEINATELR